MKPDERISSPDGDLVQEGPKWCFQCGTQYVAEVLECIECGVDTTPVAPTAASEVGNLDDSQLAYEFHEWAGQSRSTLDGMLTRQGVDHAWQGATLIVREADEQLVDSLVAEAEVSTIPTLDLSEPTIAYQLRELDDAQSSRLLRRISDAGISHTFDKNGDLFVYESDEDDVDEFFVNLEQKDAAERSFGPGVDGVEPFEVMSELFVSAGKLKKRPNDVKAVARFCTVASLTSQLSLPYGLNADVWANIVDRADELAGAVQDMASLDEDEIGDLAAELHAQLRLLV